MRKFKFSSVSFLAIILSCSLFVACQEDGPEVAPIEPEQISEATKAKF